MTTLPAHFRLLALVGYTLGGGAPVAADWRDEIGFTRLQLLAGSELPAVPVRGFSQAEALEGVNFEPDVASPLFTGKDFSSKSGTSGVSNHANSVASFFYGTPTALAAGDCPVDLYSANGWLNAAFLKLGINSHPVAQARAIENHSWISTTTSDSQATEAGKRLDFAIDRDGYVCVVGVNNGNSTTLPQLLCQSYHTISVGLVNGNHSAGFTTLDVAGRIKPDIVAPEGLTSFATPMVASAAGLLFSKLSEAPYSVAGADRSRVIKSLLLATATKDTVAAWENTASRPLDLRYGAGELNVHHAYAALRAGRGTASASVSQNPRGWSAETVNRNSTKTYYFTLAPGAPSTPFCAALTWHREVSKSTFLNNWSATLADLNLKLHHANGFTLGSLIAESASEVDNVELVHHANLAPGRYAVVVENRSNDATPYAVAWHSLPAVSVAVTQATAREMTLQAGAVTFTRTGDTRLPLLVPLQLGGDAVAGTHFQPLPASVTIPAGQATTTLAIVPIADRVAQGIRSLSVGVAADFALVREPGQSAGVTIQDKPFDAWRFDHFSSADLDNLSISAETADPDGDDLPTLVEYALGLDPRVPGLSPLEINRASGFLSLAAGKSATATDILWSAEVSADLLDWQPAVVTESESQFAAVDPVSSVAAARRFIRLKITRVLGP